MALRADIHFHLLPGVDDGPATMEEAVALARAAVRDGATTVVATPHVSDVVVEEIEDRAEQVRNHLRRKGVELEVLSGGEVAPRDMKWLTADHLKTLSVGPLESRWILLEATVGETAPERIHGAARELRSAGYGVVIAHPERCPALAGEAGMREVRRQVREGSLLLLNGPSLLGAHGPRAQAIAGELVRTGWGAAVASDAHSPKRPPVLTGAAAAVARVAGDSRAAAVVDRVPTLLVGSGVPVARRYTASVLATIAE
jgi:protein-tyrosine phosphatase